MDFESDCRFIERYLKDDLLLIFMHHREGNINNSLQVEIINTNHSKIIVKSLLGMVALEKFQCMNSNVYEV